MGKETFSSLTHPWRIRKKSANLNLVFYAGQPEEYKLQQNNYKL
jgi:hypothetical protein